MAAFLPIAWYLFLQAQNTKEPQLRFQLTGAFGVALFMIATGILITWFWRWRNKVELREEAYELRLKKIEVDFAALSTQLAQVSVASRLTSIENSLAKVDRQIEGLTTKLEPFWPLVNRAMSENMFRRSGD